jgi:ATP-dependent DNA helicase RecG
MGPWIWWWGRTPSSLKDVTYAYLGLAIIDEQHKFGVNQRSMLLDKGEHADLL